MSLVDGHAVFVEKNISGISFSSVLDVQIATDKDN
jgi:hypothetical protein